MKIKAFTMAEILLSLTIIGVVAAITLPSLTGNINERTWNTQRKALYARMSQAILLMPALNGYGTYVAPSGTLGTESYDAGIDNVAETFVTAGLSKVLKINNICDSEHLPDCGFSENWTTVKGESLDLPTQMSDLNGGLTVNTLSIKNTKAAAFETTNGESILTFYNPECVSEGNNVPVRSTDGTLGYYTKQTVCVNFVYDLNGAKGPNTVGKDIGMISAIYPVDTEVIMPHGHKNIGGTYSQNDALKKCKALNDNYRLQNVYEATSTYYNSNLIGTFNGSWTSSVVDSNNAWYVGNSIGAKYAIDKTTLKAITCIKRY